MEGVQEFNLLMLGRSGAGKSATTKLLTSNPAIRVANSLKEVTTQVAFYEGSAFEVNGQQVRFRVLDIPGLDRIDNRLCIRSSILQQLEQRQLSLHGILYVSSLTQRDTSDEQRLFGFLAQLPWSGEAKRQALIPLLTKYDNLVIDAHEEEVAGTMAEFQAVFERGGQATAWGKRVYWINQTRSLEFKISSYEDIREKYDKQVERLLQMVRKGKTLLTAQAIREMIAREERFVLQQLMGRLEAGRVAAKKHLKHHALKLHVQVEPQSLEESLTAVSASSIGLFITRVCHKEVSTTFSALLMSVPIALSLLKLASESVTYRGKQLQQLSSGESVVQSYEAICRELNREMEREWTHFNELMQFKVSGGELRCRIQPPPFKFLELEDLQLSYEGALFDRSVENGKLKFGLRLPTFKEAGAWSPLIEVGYSLRKLDECDVLRHIEELRREFCSHI